MRASNSSNRPFTAPLSPALKKGLTKSNNNNESEIHVQFGAPSYTSGEVVTGVVNLNCKIPFSPHSIVVKIKGIERLWWQNTKVETINKNGRKETKTITEDINSDKKFFIQTIELESPQATIATGQYSFPFLYKLPTTLPASFFEEGGDKQQGDAYSCKILYKVKAAVYLTAAEKPFLKETSWIVVNEAIDTSKKLQNVEAKKALVAKKGSVHAKVWMDKHAHTPGETALSKVKVNNSSVKPNKFIRMSVIKHLDLKANGAEKHLQQNIYSHEFPGLTENFYGVMWLPFHLPVSMLPSVSLSTNLKSHYLVNIEVDVPTTSEMALSIPIFIRVPDTFFSGMQVQPPPGPVPTTIAIRPPWQADNSAQECQECRKSFSLVARRHHCRHCGRLLCANCCSMESTLPRLGLPSAVRVCTKCYPEASKGGTKGASSKKHMEEFYKLHPPPLAIKAPPPPTKEEAVAGVLKQIETAENDCKAKNWSSVLSKKTPLLAFIESNRQHFDNAFVDDVKARYTICETEANRAVFDEQVKALVAQLEKLGHQAETASDLDSFDATKSVLRPLLDRAQTAPYATTPVLQELVPVIIGKMKQWESNYAKGQTAATAQAKLKAIQQQLENATKEAGASHFKNAKASLSSAGNLIAEMEASTELSGLDFVPSALIQFKAQITASRESMTSAKVTFKISQIKGFVASVDGMIGQSKIEDALKQVEQANAFLSKLAKYSNFAIATSFLSEGPALITGASEKCSHAKTVKEAEDRKSNFNTRIIEAENCVLRDQYDDAKQKLEQARNIIDELHHNFYSSQGVEEFVHKGKERIDSIYNSINEKQFSKELTKKKDMIDNRLFEAENHLKNDRFDSVTEKLDEAKAVLADLAVEPFSGFAGTKAIADKATERINKLASDSYSQKHSKEARNKMEWISTLKGNVQSCIQRAEYDNAVAKIEETRTKIAELDNPSLNSLEQVSKFISDTLTALVDLEGTISAQKFERYLRDKKDMISSRFTQAENYLKRESWDSVAEMVEEARGFINELSDPQYAAAGGLADYIAQSLAKAQKFLDDSFSQRYGKESRNKMDYIKTLKGNADRQFGLSQWDQSLSSIESVRTELEKLNVEPLNQLPDVIKFLAEIPLALDQLEANVSSGRHGKEARDKMDYIKTLRDGAERQLGYSQWDQALSSVETVREYMTKLDVEPFNQLADVIKFLADVSLTLDQLVANVSSGRNSKEARDKMDYIKTLRDGAQRQLGYSQWDQCLGSVESTREAIAKLNVEPFNQLPEVVKFLSEVTLTLDEIVEKVSSGRYGKEAKDKMDYINTLKSGAKEHIRLEQWDQGVDKIEDCRTRTSVLDAAPFNTIPSVVTFLQEIPPQLDAMLEQITSGRYAKDAKNKMEYLKTLRGAAAQHIKVDQWDQAIGKIEDIRTRMQELENEPFNKLPTVTAFLEEYPPALDKMLEEITQAKYGKQAKNTMEYLGTLRGIATQNVKNEQWDQAIGKIEEIRTKMQEIDTEPFNTKIPAVITFLKDFPPTLDKLSNDIVAAKFGKQARNTIDWLKTLRSTAQQNVKVDQWDQATGKIEEARTKLQDLEAEPYNTLPNVIEFMKEYPASLDKLSEDIIAAKFGKEARNKMEYLGTLRTIATQNVKNTQWDQAIDKIEDARTRLLDLDTEPFNTKLPNVIEFLKTYPATLDKLEEEITAGKFGKEARNKMEWLGTLRSVAAQHAKVDQWDQALGKIEEARTKLVDLDTEPYNTKIPAVIEFLKEYPATITKIEDDIIVAKFSKDARNKMEYINTLKGIAAQNITNSQWDQALDKIEEARSKLQDLDVEPFNTKLPSVIQFLNDIPPVLQKQVDDITVAKFSREARDKMDYIKTLKGIAQQNIQNEQWGQAVDKIEESRTKLQDLDKEPFNTDKFPTVIPFLKEMHDIFTKFEEDIVIKKYSKEAKNKMDWVGTLKGIAADNMEKEQWDQSSGKLEEARAVLQDLSQEPFTKVPAVVAFLEEMPPKLDEIEDQIVQRKFSKVAKGKMEWLGTLKGVAEQFLQQEQWDRVLDQVEQARGVILEITQEPFTKLQVVNNFVSDYAPKLEKIVQDVVERKFSKVAKNKMEWANTLIGIAQQNVGNDQFDQAVDKLEEARNVVLELGQEPYTMLPTVEAFVATKNAAIAALEQQVIEKKFSKLVKNKIEYIGTLKGLVQQHVKVDQFDQAVGKIEEVREKLYEISQEPYDKIAFVVEFVQESTSAFNKIEEEIIASKFSKVANNKMDWVKTLKGIAEDNVEKDQWDQAVDKIEQARTIIYELSQETYLSIPAVGAFVSNMEPIFYGLEEKMADKKFRKEAKSKKEWLDTLRGIATERSKVEQWDQALDKLEEARQIAYTLKQEPFSKLSDIVAFATQTEAALDTLEKDIASAKFSKAAKNKMDYAKTLKGIAVDNVSKDQWDQASQKIEEIRDVLGELLQLPFSALPAVSEFTASIVPEIDAIEKELNEKRFAKVAKGRMEWAQTNHQIAKQSLDVDKWDDTFAKIEIARDVLYELSQEPYTQLAAVVAFVEQITPQLTTLYNSTIEKKFAKEAKGKMEYVGTLTSVASQFAGNDQFDQSLGKIEEARDVISVLKQEPYNVLEVVNNFVGPAAESLSKIEDKIREIKYNKEIKNKTEWVGTLLGVSKQNIDAEQWGQSVDKIEQIRTILSDLQQDPDLWASPVVKTFVAETGPKVEALEREIVERQFGKELKNKMEWVNTLKGVATQFATNDQWEQALEKVEAGLQIVFELSQEPYAKIPAAGEFCENIKPAFEKIQTEVAEKKISKAAKNKMEYASTLKNIASDNQDKEQWDQALDKVESSRQVLFELSMEPYTILPYVQSFISETTTALDKIDQLIVENKFAKVARNKMEWVNTLINVAKDFVSKDSWDTGLAKVEEARQVLSELGQEPFTKLPAVVAFVTENIPSLDKIEQSVVEAKFSKQTKSKIDRVGTLKHQVKAWIERENWDTAFQEIENARQALFELSAEPYCKLAVATEFVKETTPLLDQFEEDILHKKLSKDTRNKMEWVGTLIGTSNNMLFREHWDSAYEKLYEARDVLEALNREPYTRINGVTAFVAEKTKVIEEGEQQIIENKYNKEAKNRVQYFGTLKHVANDNVQKEQWDQALDKVEVARQVVSDLNEEPYNKLPIITVFLNSSPLQQLEQIEQQVIERKFAKVVKGKIEWCNTLKGVAREFVSKDQWDQALSKIEELRSLLLELSEEPFSKLPASTAVVATETPEANKLEQQIFERKFAKEVQGKMEWARTLLNVANQCYEKDQWDQALDKIEEGREVVTTLNEEPYNQLSIVPKFVQELTSGFDNTSQRIIEAKFSKEAKNKQEYVGTLRDVANQNIQNEQWDQALDKIEAARSVIFELQQEPFSQIGTIANFTQTASASLDKADQTIIEAKFTKDAFNKMEWVGTISRIAADNSRVEQWDQATGKLEEARQMIYVLSQEPYNKLATVTKFIENSTTTLNNIEQQIIEKKFAKESKNKIDYASTLKNTASSYLFREQWDGALEKIEEAKAVVSELSQEPYSKLPMVVKFTEEITPALDKFIVQVNEQKFGKEAKNKLEYLSTLKNVANDFMSKEQWDQSLDNLEKARTLLSELSEEPYSLLPVVQNATKDTSVALDKIDQQIVERKFNKVAKGKMEWAGTLKSTAKQSLDTDQWDAALSKLEDMRSVLDELTEDPFSRLSVVTAFVEKERPQVAKIEQQIIERKFSKEVQSKIDWLGTIVQVANQCLEKEQWDQAVNHVEDGRSVLSELSEEPFNKLVIAGRAVSKSQPLLDKIEQQITENKFGKEARNKQEYLGTLKSVALDFLQKDQFDSALHQVETAKQLISELTQDPYSKLPAVVKYAQDTLTTLNKIEQDVATTKFAKLSKDKMEYVNTLLGVATNFVQKNQFDQGTQQLEQARQALTELSEDPFDKLPVVAKFVSTNNATVSKLEQQIVETKFNKEAKNKMDYATSLKSTASSYLFREMWDQANTKIEEARTVVTELSQDPFSKLPIVTAFIAEISPNLTKVQQQVAENKFGKEARGKIEHVGTLKGSVVEFVNNAQYDQAIGKLEEARTYLSELDKEPFNVLPVVQKCAKDQGAAFDKIEQQIIEKKFLKVAKDKMSHIGTLKGVARDALNRENWDNAFHELSTARTSLVELSEEPFTKLPICVTFVEKENVELDKIEQKIVEQKFGKEAKNKMEYANTLRGVASDFSQKEQWDQAIGKIEEANNVISELQAEPFNKLPQVNNFVQTIVQSLAKIEQQIIERKFSKQAKDKMEYSNTLKATATTNVEHEQWDQAVEKIEACRNSVQELSEEPFNKLPHVVRFAKDQSGALDRLEQEMSEKRFAKLAKDKMDWANTLKGIANDCCEKQQWDQGFEKIEEGRKVLDELNQPPLNKISAVINFIGNFTAEFEKIENTILAKKVGKAAQDKLSWITTCLNSAGQALSICGYDKALGEIEKAREVLLEIDAAPFNKLQNCVSACKDLRDRASRLEAQTQEKRLTSSFFDKVAYINTLVDMVPTFINQGNNGRATEELEKARDKIEELAEPPFRVVAAFQVRVKELRKTIGQLEAKLGAEFVKKIVTDKISKAQFYLGEAESKKGTTAAVENVEKARDVLQELLEPSFKSVEQVSAALPTLQSRIAAIDKQLASTTVIVKAAPGQLVSPTGPISDVFGPWVPFTESGMVSGIKPDPKVPTNTRTFIHKWNPAVDDIGRKWKKFVTAVFVEGDRLEKLYALAGRGKQNWNFEPPIEETFKVMDQLRKDISYLIDKPPVDPTGLTENIVEQYKEAAKRWKANTEHLENVSRLTDGIHRLLNMRSMYLLRETSLQTPASFAKGELGELFGRTRGLHLGPIQDEVEERIRLIGEYQSTFHDGRVYGYHYDSSKEMSLLDFQMETVSRYVDMFRSEDKSKKNSEKKKSEVDGVRKALKRLEPFPQIYKVMIEKFHQEWDREFMYFQPYRYTKDCELEWWEVTTKPSPLVFDLKFLIEVVGMTPFDPVSPGTPEQSGLPFQSPASGFKAEFELPPDQEKLYAGKFLFSAAGPISNTFVKADALGNSFVLSDDLEIYSRAFWPACLGNFALGKSKLTGAPFYLTAHKVKGNCCVNRMLYIKTKIDGKEVKPLTSVRHESMAWDASGNSHSFRNKSIPFAAVGSKVDSERSSWDNWGLGKRRLMKYLIDAGPGKHTVELSIQFVFIGDNIWDRPQYDHSVVWSSLPSHPLAVGSFDIVVPEGFAIPSSFPEPKIESVPLSALNNFYKNGGFARVPTHLLWATQDSDWYLFKEREEIIEYEEKFGKIVGVKKVIPPVYAKNYCCLVYVNPEDGWNARESVFESINIVTAVESRDWANLSGVLRDDFHGSYFEVELLPQSMIDKIPNRCSEEMRFKTLLMPF